MITYIILTILCTIYLVANGGGKIDLSKDKVLSIRGLLAVFIVVHHCSFTVNNIICEYVFGDIGMWICGIFFMQSGYALGVGTDKYIRMNAAVYFRKRVCKIFFDVLVLSLLYQCLQLGMGQYDIIESLCKLSIGNTSGLLPFSWFIWELILLYVIYYISNKFKFRTLALWILTLLLMVIFYSLHFGCEWYMSTLSFPLGVLIARCNLNLTKKRLIVISILSLMVYALYKVLNIGQIYVLVVPILAMSLNYLLSNSMLCRYTVLNKLADISFYIYMFQGFAFFTINRTSVYQYPLLYIGLVIILSVVMSLTYVSLRNRFIRKR